MDLKIIWSTAKLFNVSFHFSLGWQRWSYMIINNIINICFSVVEPVAIFGMAYLAFILAEMFHFSGIIRYDILSLHLSRNVSFLRNYKV